MLSFWSCLRRFQKKKYFGKVTIHGLPMNSVFTKEVPFSENIEMFSIASRVPLGSLITLLWLI